MSSTDDRTTASRIRDAAVRYVAKHGWDHTTSRQIAAEAGVPVGLVNYHFGSKAGLRTACDEWVVAATKEYKEPILQGGPMPRASTLIDEHPELQPILDYVAMSMRAGGPLADHFFENMVEMTQQMMELGAEQGMIRAYDDTYAAAVVLVGYGVGSSLFSDTIARLLGGKDLFDPDTYERYTRTAVEMFTYPFFADERYLNALAETLSSASADVDIPKEKK